MAKLKKSAHVLETEELLDLIDKDDSEVEPALVFKNDVLSFISTFAIEP